MSVTSSKLQGWSCFLSCSMLQEVQWLVQSGLWKCRWIFSKQGKPFLWCSVSCGVLSFDLSFWMLLQSPVVELELVGFLFQSVPRDHQGREPAQYIYIYFVAFLPSPRATDTISPDMNITDLITIGFCGFDSILKLSDISFPFHQVLRWVLRSHFWVPEFVGYPKLSCPFVPLMLFNSDVVNPWKAIPFRPMSKGIAVLSLQKHIDRFLVIGPEE